ncbi:hypothetical protein [Aminobacter niigataensis]|uniref:hypothetical protein n=1 Tax=Aminobacter niigataensis TaxID=83265 RepID=UPI00298ED63A|nr:hypothetical protein [Aminobacter niigataensis]
MKMRKNAEAGGFNPLTALRAGGGAGFTTTHSPALASGQFIAEAIGGIGNAIASIDPMRDQTAKLEHQIKQATLANIQADTATRLRASIGGVPVSTGARVVQSGSPLALPKPGQPFGPEVPALPKQDEIINPFPTGSGVEIPGWLKSGDAWESFLGDLGTIPATAVNLTGTIYHNFRKYRPDVDKYIRDYANRPRPPANIGIRDAMDGRW